MSDEEWRKVPGLPEWLEVSNMGRARSLPHVVTVHRRRDSTPFSYTAGGKMLSLTALIRGGYPILQYRTLQKGAAGKHTAIPVHKAVLLAFVGAPPSSHHECCHRDGNPKNNAAENLYWGLRSENIADTVRHERVPWHVSLTPADVLEIRKRGTAGEKQAAIAQDFNIDQSTVSQIINRKRWKWLP